MSTPALRVGASGEGTSSPQASSQPVPTGTTAIPSPRGTVASPVAEPVGDLIYERLLDQISWYDRKSRAAQRTFKRIKIAEILAAALIPFLTGIQFHFQAQVIGGLGVMITILEGVLHLNQYSQNWAAYRSTCESLKHEKYVYLGHAGPYAGSADARAQLAERVESLVSQEHAQWVSVQQQQAKADSTTGHP